MATKPIWAYTTELRRRTAQFHGLLLSELRRRGFRIFSIGNASDPSVHKKVGTLFDICDESLLKPMVVEFAKELAKLQTGKFVTLPFLSGTSDISATCQADNLLVRATMFKMINQMQVEFGVLCPDLVRPPKPERPNSLPHWISTSFSGGE